MLITRAGSNMAPSWDFQLNTPDININAHVQIPRDTALPVPSVGDQQLAGVFDMFDSPVWRYRKPLVIGGIALVLFGIAGFLR